MRLRKRLKHGVAFRVIRFLLVFVNQVPRRLALFAGAVLGLAAWWLLPRERYRMFRHLGVAYGDGLSSGQKQNIGRQFFINSGKNLTDTIRCRKHFPDEIKPLVSVEGFEHFDAAYRRGNGVVGVTGHLGNFELGAIFVAALGYKMAVIGREMLDPKLDELLVGNRETLGLTNLSTTDSVRKSLKWLKAGGVIGVIIDTDSIRVRSIFVPAFGRLALTPVGQTLIGLRAGAAFVPMACLRTADDRYRLIVRPEVKAESSGDIDADAYDMTAACTRQLESIISENPDQWIWLKNRWLTSAPQTA
ncbi:MAG: lysophospholipid acyltransferase family protein [candidate division Zixibacteria bacterium]|nr:lysophospholipid acyltransferase family protein [candidate division Zixibacteria bacterium]